MKTRSTALLVAGIAGVGILVGIRHYGGDACCSGHDKAAAPSATQVTATIAPADAVDPVFEGCKASCGSHSPSLRAAARTQPGAALADVVHCPVSGAVFRVAEGTAKRELAGKSLYFCCASCAAYFDTHRAEVLTARGLDPSGA